MKRNNFRVVIIMLFVVWALAVFCFKQCTSHKVHNSGRHYIEYVSHGITNKMYFYSETNPYIGKLEERNGKYVLTVMDTVTSKEYILMTDDRIRINGGDIKIKEYGETYD